MGNLINLRHLDLSVNWSITKLPKTICNLRELQTLDLGHCSSLSQLPEEIHKLINLRHLPNDFTGLLQIPQGLQQLTALRTLATFSPGRGLSKLGYLKELNQLSGSLELKISLHDKEDVMEAQKAELRNKRHIKRLTILFVNRREVLNEEELVTREMMEALHPPPSLQCLLIIAYQGTKFPNWITSSLNNLKDLQFSRFDYCSTLPPLGMLPCLEKLYVIEMSKFKFLDREFLGISGDIDGSTPSGFPKLKELNFQFCLRWEEWEDTTAEEANSALLIMPCLRKLMIECCGLTTLPHRLLRKASALEYLTISGSSHLKERYGDKNGSGLRLLSHIPNVEVR